jgi:hypothetical protein
MLSVALALFATAEYSARRSSLDHLGRLDAQRDLAHTIRALRKDLQAALAVEILEAGAPTPAGTSLLVLEVPGQTARGDPHPSIRDRVVYEILPGEGEDVRLRRRLEPAGGSERLAVTTLLTRRLDELAVTAVDGGRRHRVQLTLRGSTGLVPGGVPIDIELTVPRQPAVLGGGE